MKFYTEMQLDVSEDRELCRLPFKNKTELFFTESKDEFFEPLANEHYDFGAACWVGLST